LDALNRLARPRAKDQVSASWNILEKRPEGDAASAEAEPDSMTMGGLRRKGKGGQLIGKYQKANQSRNRAGFQLTLNLRMRRLIGKSPTLAVCSSVRRSLSVPIRLHVFDDCFGLVAIAAGDQHTHSDRVPAVRKLLGM
jgi:hypothetical protein